MKVFLLCPGPSLRVTFPGADDGDVIIGVNRAYRFVECDWLAAFDADTMKALDDGNAKVFTRSAHQPEGRGISLEAVAGAWPNVRLSDAGMFTACGSLLLAAYLGATDIWCHGCDWSIGADWDGKSADGVWREAERWRRESGIWGHICVELLRQGVRVNRVAPRLPEQ